MSRITIVDNEYMLVEYLPDHKVIAHTVRQPVSGQIFRDALQAGTEALKQYGACKWMSDDRLNGPLPPEDNEWGTEVWGVRTMEAGWKYWALVVPQAIVAAGSLVPVVEAYHEQGLRVMVFTTPENALDWLDKQKA